MIFFIINIIVYIVKEKNNQQEDKSAIRMNKASLSYFSGMQVGIDPWKVSRPWAKQYLAAYLFPHTGKIRFVINLFFKLNNLPYFFMLMRITLLLFKDCLFVHFINVFKLI